MKKFIITCDTKWCGTDRQHRALAESEDDLWKLADELAYDNFYEFFDTCDILEDLELDPEDLSDDEIDEILSELDYLEYYWAVIDECDDEEWDRFDDESYIYTITKEK